MLRRLSLALFVLALGLAVACGRQVTPNPTSNSALAGEILLRFRTHGAPNFALYNYFLVVNTSGNGQEPYPSGFVNNQYVNFSYAVVTGLATGGNGTVLPLLVQYYLLPNGAFARPFNLNPGTTEFEPLTATTSEYSEFTVVFARSQLALPFPNATTPPPTPSPTPTRKPDRLTAALMHPDAAPTPSPTPTGAQTGSPSNPTPVASATIASQATWCMNLVITGQNTSVPLDALGTGATDHSFSSGCFNVNDSLDQVYLQPPESFPPQDPSSWIYGFELINNP